MRDDGTLYIDKAAMRRAAEELGDGRTFLFFLAIAADADDGILPSGNVRAIAPYFNLPMRAVTAMLTTLAGRGWIEWNKSPNQWTDGSIRVLRDISWHGEVD